jgi:hypothetical protein
MVWISSYAPYGAAEEILKRIGHRQIPGCSIWGQTQRYGRRLKAYVAQQQERVGVERVKLPPPGRDHRQRQGISMDGGMVHIRGEGWKEVKVGAVFDVDMRLERDEKTGDLVQRPHGSISPTQPSWVRWTSSLQPCGRWRGDRGYPQQQTRA